MAKKISVQPTAHGVNFGYGGASFHSPDQMPGLGGDALRSALTNLAERDEPLHDETIPDAIPSVRMRLFSGAVFPVVGAAIDAARRAKSDAHAADGRLMEPALDVPPAFAIDHLNSLRSLDASGQARWIEQAELEALTSAVAAGNRAGLADAIWSRAAERYWVENWIERFVGKAAHPAEPSVDLVLAVGPDEAAIRAEAEGYRKQHIERMEYVDAMESTARQLVLFLAAVFDISPAEAIDRAMGRPVDAKAA